MVFNSYTFVLFFAVVLLLHHLPIPWRIKKSNLLVASYLFYAAWNPPFVALIWISTIVDWYVARSLARADKPAWRALLLCASLGTNLGLLAFFKYGNFLLEGFVSLAALLDIDFHPATMDIILPIGISFYTFQTLSYTIDVYRRNTGPWPSFLDFALFVTFFPQLVAGPIVRAVNFLPQCSTPRRATGRQFAWGLFLFALGIFEKIAIADGLAAPVSDAVFGAGQAPSFLSAWCGAFAFSVQIFCDFAGYSSCAVGAAMCLGFGIPDNFHFPYAAIGFSDFWRRWHISLSSWLRDYLYIPLGGNRKGQIRTQANLMVTMLLGGLWHGASWTFVFWGGLHGAYLLIERIAVRRLGSRKAFGHSALKPLYGLATFVLVCFTWVFFRAKSFPSAFEIAGAMLGATSNDAAALVDSTNLAVIAILTALTLSIHWKMRGTTLEEALSRWPWWLLSLSIAAMLVLVIISPGEDRAFIYFQF